MRTPAALHPESQSMLDMAALGKPLEELASVAEARRVSLRGSLLLGGKVEYQGEVSEVFIPSEHVRGGIPTYIYKPSGVGENASILVYFHGGGMVLECRESVDTLCKTLSTGAACIVVNVEYRLAPEHKFPAMMEDGETAMRWVLQNKGALGGGSESRVGMGGDSAGGMITASVCHSVAGIAYQILVYPKVNLERTSSSYQIYGDGYILTQKLMKWFTEQFFDSTQYDPQDPRMCALYGNNFSKLPPALFVVAECDPVKDDSYVYAEKLKEAGVYYEIYLAKGAVHTFYARPGHFKQCCKEAYAKTIEFIKRHGAPDINHPTTRFNTHL